MYVCVCVYIHTHTLKTLRCRNKQILLIKRVKGCKHVLTLAEQTRVQNGQHGLLLISLMQLYLPHLEFVQVKGSQSFLTG
jgi:hypothetical protein